jgi:hypothetical protein
MAYGRAGSTLTDELNRLAAGGGTSYPAKTLYLAGQGAANKWAGTSGLGIVGALNIKNGTTNPAQFKGLNAVCNALAGTTGLEAVTALREVAS